MFCIQYFHTIYLANIILDEVKNKDAIIDGVLKGCNEKWTLEKFKFAQIVTTEHVDKRTTKKLATIVKDLGKIEVVVCRMNRTQNRKPEDSDVSDDGTPEAHGCSQHSRPFQCHPKIPEKALKCSALSHRADLAKPIRVNKKFNSWDKPEEINTEDEPFARFVFRYRSRTKQSRRTEIKPEPATETHIKREKSPEYDEILASARNVKVRKIEAQEVVNLEDDDEIYESEVNDLEDDDETKEQEASSLEDDDQLVSL
ncbi:hypothetical protein MMC11_001259 [Xylographa trunciseda]|nr:hypothetical protein [Xylographa trunciseda]